ncbi:MAG: efflux RND transporter periplasmic adaptor subunit, partial [Pseudomonadota bacterium]
MQTAKIVTGLVAGAALLAAGFIVGRQATPDGDDSSGDKRDVLYWVAPMDPDYRRDGPGKSPMGMDLVPVYAGDTPADDGIAVAPNVIQTLGVRTAPAERRPLGRQVTAVGTVVWDESTVERLHPYVDGWLREVGVGTAGDTVAAGDPVYSLYSPTLIAAQREYLSAHSGSARLAAGARERLLALGMSEPQIAAVARRGRAADEHTRRAERDAVVLTIEAREGSYVAPQTVIVTLVDPSRVWLDVEAPQRSAALVTAGQPVRITFDAWPGDIWSAEVQTVYPALDPATRSIRARLTLDNADGRLRPGMLANVRIAQRDEEAVLSVPREAV